MTILEAIKKVLVNAAAGYTTKEIYELIVREDLYTFKATNPQHVVNTQIRRHCKDLDFPTAHPVKYFCILRFEGKKPCYALMDKKMQVFHSKQIKNTHHSELPEEKIAVAFKEHIVSVQNQLLDSILERHPSFFEQLVVKLLLKMGYGYDETSGIVTGGAHDGGIDGIISEDKLGLDQIYLQAKRYSQNAKVKRSELQAFVGAMQNIQKGVFITTSDFTREAYEYAKGQQQKALRLINGTLLTEYMTKFEVGVNVVDVIKLYQINNDYFIE